MATVLIVDDDKHTRALLRTIFQQDPRFARHALSVIEAGDGKEGLALFDAEKPAIVVTDLLMPKMDGFQLCEAIRARPYGADTGIIVVSGVYRDSNASTRVKREFGGSFFAKPYQLGDLASAVDALLVNPKKKPSELQVSPVLSDTAAAGTLVETPLPRLLLDFWEKRSTGALEIKRAGLEKRIDLVVGHPVSVSSNQRSEALGEFLLARRIITPAQHQRALKRAHDQGHKLGEALVELEIMTSAQLVKALTAQARAKIVSALRWQEGTWTYTPNRDLLDRHKGNALDPGAVVLLGLKQTGHLDDSIKAVDAIGGRPLVLTSRGEKLRATIARAFGDKLLGALDKPASVATILEAFPDAATVMHALETLISTGCLEATGGRSGTTVVLSRGADPIALAGLSQQAGRPRAQTQPPARAAAGALERNPRPTPGSMLPKDTIEQITVVGGPVGDFAVGEPTLRTPRPTPRPTPSSPAGTPTPTPAAAAVPSGDQRRASLMAQLFGEDSSISGDFGEPLPQAVPEPLPDEESGVIEVYGLTPPARAPHRAEIDAARELLLAEYLRVQGPDLYEVLKVGSSADEAELEAAYKARLFDFSLERFASLDLGPDHGKLEEIHAAYRRAHETLGDARRRAEFDARQHTPVGAPTALVGELAFHEGEKRLAEGDLAQAIGRFEAALEQVPNSADYHAALGWTLYRAARAAGPSHPGEGADAGPAIARLDEALAIDPDNAAAHEYVGRILVDRGELTDEAARHLEQALASRPPRVEALLPLDRLRSQRHEFAALERQYRLLIHSLGDADKPLALRLWLALAELYRTRLEDADAARTALTAAARLSPDDPSIPRALDELTAGRPELWDQRVEALRTRWRLDPGDAEAGRALFHGALERGLPDQAFVAAALLGQREPDDQEALAHYEKHRPRFLARGPARPLSLEDEPGLRHPEDSADLAALFALLQVLANTRAPLLLAELQVTPENRRADAALPEAFASVRAWAAEVLAVPVPPVYERADFDDQVHAAAPSDSPPLLLVGPRALAQENKLILGFALCRAMTYLWPGRGIAGSRPARRLKSMLLGCLAAGGFGAGGVALAPDDTLAQESRTWMLGAQESRRSDVQRLLLRLTAGKANLNLSRWLRAMSCTADRVGLVLSGDPAVALRGAASAGGSDAAEELLGWATSVEHLRLRRVLGRSIDV
jgi:CheY-like chemotaxis protein/tetratricopeptide (TPR) repeat protein